MTVFSDFPSKYGVTLNPEAQQNGNNIGYDIRIIGNLLPEGLKKLLLNGEAHSDQVPLLESSQQQAVEQSDDILAENNRENIEGQRSDDVVKSTGSSSIEVTASNEIVSQPENHDNAAGSSHTLTVEEANTVSLREETITLDPSEAKSREILKSILYGGLTELVTSLGIVSSAAGTHTATGKIVAVSFSSLIVGLFVLGYKIADLWMNKNQGESDETVGEVDQYEELLGNRQNYRLHFTVAILSFLIFGLVPPLVYGFTFRRSEDKFSKMVAVGGVSFLCMVLLGSMKAHLQKPENCLGYIQTIGNCFIDAVGASVLPTFAGGLIEKYIEQSGWFEPNKMPTLLLSDMAIANLTWGSF